MIKRLSISQYVIIDQLTIDFESGLTVLTGETGAGKSILLGALGLILGEEVDREAIRQASNESHFEAFFQPPPDHPVWAFLAAREGLAVHGPDLTITRAIDRIEKDEIKVNGQLIDLEYLKKLGTYLVEIHGQFANQNFMAPETQLLLLDAFGAYSPGVLENVAHAWAEIGRITRAIDEERAFFAVAEREKIGIERVVSRIDKFNLSKDSYNKLTAELGRLTICRDVRETFQSINAQLIAQSGAEIALARVSRTLATQVDPALDTMKECVRIALEQTRLAIEQMQELAPKYLDIDTSGIHKIEKILAELRAIAVERKVPPEGLYEHYQYLSARLNRIRKAPVKIKELDDDLIKANHAYRDAADILSAERTRAAQKLSAAINAEMPPLKLMSAQIRIEVSENTLKPTELGINDVTFTARMNPGMPFSPISKTASGGELARLILAVKMILQQVQCVSTLVFDEIDTGIGGAAAAAVGSRIAKLAESAQILVITHSPQVASRGNQHLHVSKKTDGKSTRTIVDQLTLEQRIDEISRMLAGEELTGESRAAAKTLIDEAEKAVKTRHAEEAARREAEKAQAEERARQEAARAQAAAQAAAQADDAPAPPPSDPV